MVWLTSEKIKYLRKVASLEKSIEVLQQNSNTAPEKGSVTLSFMDESEANVFVPNVNIKDDTIIIPSVDVENDEILIQDFQIQVAQEIGVGFKIYCRPKVGWHTGTVKIKYLIL